MSLTNVLLIHVSSRYAPHTAEEEAKEQEQEYYTLLELPKYAPITEIRKAYRRITLRLQCDRMMLEWNSEAENTGATRDAINQKERALKEAFRILGDKHLRQQYHLLQCRTSRYRMIHGPLHIINGITHSRRWFPLLVLQSVIVATMVNAVVAQYETQDWVWVLIPAWIYYGIIVLFWLAMQEFFFWRKQCTLRSMAAMFCAFAQHASFWLGCFWMTRYWDRATGPLVSWYVLAIPFYLAIGFRCGATRAAVWTLRDLQSKMISREHLDEHNQSASNKEDGADNLPEGYIVVTTDSAQMLNHLAKLPLTTDHNDPKIAEAARVETSPEYRQVDHAATSLHQAALKLAILGTIFITLMVLKLEGPLDISFWIIFAPIWIHLGIRLFAHSRAPNRSRPAPTNNNNNNNNGTTSADPATVAPFVATTTSTTLVPSSSNNNNPLSPTTAATTPKPASDETATTSPTTPDIEAANGSASTMDVASKSLSTGEYTAVNVVMDLPTRSTEDDDEEVPETASLTPSEIPEDYPEQAAAAAEMDVEVGLVPSLKTKLEALPDPTTATDAPTSSSEEAGEQATDITPPAVETAVAVANVNDNNNSNNIDSSTTEDEEDSPAVHEEFERWQSVYENQDVRVVHFQFIPCEVLFQLLIVAMIVAKLDEDYQDTSPEGSNFNAFFILLVPFALGLCVCCCAVVAGFVALHTEQGMQGGADANAENVDAAGGADAAGEVDPDELPPMQAGSKTHQQKTFATHIDISYPDLTFSQRVQLLTTVLPVSTQDAESWVWANDGVFTSSRNKTIWEQVVKCAEIHDCHTVKEDEEDIDVGSFDKECMALLRKNLRAHFDKAKFQETLDAIEPLDDSDNDDEDEEEAGNVMGLECPVCCEDYKIEDMVHCEGDPMHFFCRGCFHRFATETIEAGDVAGMPCADANCEATFATPTVTANLSTWDLLRMEDRENERNQKVALAAKAVLNCPCGAVGIVTEEEMGDGRISCPGCDREYCGKCGQQWHPETSCPPTKKVLEWVVQNTMPCPNCHTPIEKNLGCDHMYCSPGAGGCGHHFSYRTGKPMSKHGRNLRGLYHG